TRGPGHMLNGDNTDENKQHDLQLFPYK
ncbi:hemolysin domain protein, partial [Escherichia coli]|nr:hemolysin domain protein [Escherichia coli]